MPDEEHEYDGPSLDVDGNLSKRFEPLPEPAAPPDTAIELAERGPKHLDPTPTSYRPEPRPRRRLAPVVVALSASLGLAIFVATLALPTQVGGVWRSLGTFVGPRHAVIVTSEPPGATVKIAGAIVGQTPWAGDNLWGDTEVTVELTGYQRWTGRLDRKADVKLNAVLKR